MKKFFDNNKIVNINLLYLLSLLPIVIFSSYKNGLMAVNEGKMDVLLSFKYLSYPILIILVSYLLEYIYFRVIKMDEDNNNVVNSLVPFFNLLCYFVSGPSDNILIIISIIILVHLVSKVINVNYVALFKIMLFSILTIYGVYNNANIYQVSNQYSNFKLFMGLGICEMGYSTLFSIISFIILLFNEYYKKDIPIMIMVCYMVVSLGLVLFNVIGFNDMLVNIFNSGLVFIVVYVCSISLYSPNKFRNKVIYSCILGIFFSIFVNVFEFNIGIYITIFGYSFIYSLIKFIKKKFLVK